MCVCVCLCVCACVRACVCACVGLCVCVCGWSGGRAQVLGSSPGIPKCHFNASQVEFYVRNIERCTKDEYSLFGSRCTAIETQIVSTSLLDRVQYSSYGTDAVSVEIRHKIETDNMHPCYVYRETNCLVRVCAKKFAQERCSVPATGSTCLLHFEQGHC